MLRLPTFSKNIEEGNTFVGNHGNHLQDCAAPQRKATNIFTAVTTANLAIDIHLQ
jgi:hypothetical protein